jgi:hypothetical protein
MIRKFLILGALLGFSALGLQNQASASNLCSNAYCSNHAECACPPFYPAPGLIVSCDGWRENCI